MQEIKLLSIVIPTYNESETIHLILDKVRDVQLVNNIDKEILIVNDCSICNTEEVIKRYIENNN